MTKYFRRPTSEPYKVCFLLPTLMVLIERPLDEYPILKIVKDRFDASIPTPLPRSLSR
ncbi:MAG: hypothetical protein K8T91_02190 [Planctomycetes bacterium]|nr:hypothetical protein [Planctomycetota bacterium]